jgi:glycosyltransferase involved in cell wall biosynthesis
MEIEKPMNENLRELTFSNDIKNYLNTTSKWATFLAILGFISIGFLVLAGISMTVFGTLLSDIAKNSSSAFTNMLFPYIGIVYILFAVLYFFPSLYLYNFANKVKKALAINIQEELEESFKNLKKLFKFLGVMTIILISSYIILIPTIVFFAALSKM